MISDDLGTSEDHPEIYMETTANMNDFTGSTYISKGWDFSTIWEINAGQNDSYPMLQWENN